MRKFLSLLLVLCMLLGTTVAAEASETRERIRVGDFTFEQPIGYSLIDYAELAAGLSRSVFNGTSGNFMIFSIDYLTTKMSIDMFDGGPITANLVYGLLLMGADTDAAFNYFVTAKKTTHAAVMPNGGDLLAWELNDQSTLFSHYYRDHGFITVALYDSEKHDDAYAEAMSIATSFRLDGVTPEQMLADAEAAANATDGDTKQ